MSNNEFNANTAPQNQQNKPRFANKQKQNHPENNGQFTHDSRFQKPAGQKPYREKKNFNNAIGEQLGRFRDNEQIDYIKRPPALMRAASSWEGDSIDHINVQNNAITPIGRFLAHNSNFTFRHSHYGDFASIESFAVWLTTVERDDRLRTCSGNEAHYQKRKLTHRPVTNMRAILLDADFQKLNQYPEALAAFKESTLPFDNYFFERCEESVFPRRSITGTWKIEGWEELRAAVKENRAPDLRRWIDVPNSGIFDYVISNDGKKKTGPAILERIPTPKEFRTSVFSGRRDNVGNTNSHQGNKHSTVVNLEKGNKGVDLNKNPSLKNRVHVVELVDSTVNEAADNKALMSEAAQLPDSIEQNTPMHVGDAIINLEKLVGKNVATDPTTFINNQLNRYMKNEGLTMVDGAVVPVKPDFEIPVSLKLEVVNVTEDKKIYDTVVEADEYLNDEYKKLRDAGQATNSTLDIAVSAASSRGQTSAVFHVDEAGVYSNEVGTNIPKGDEGVTTAAVDVSKAIEKASIENTESAGTSIGAAFAAALKGTAS